MDIPKLSFLCGTNIELNCIHTGGSFAVYAMNTETNCNFQQHFEKTVGAELLRGLSRLWGKS